MSLNKKKLQVLPQQSVNKQKMFIKKKSSRYKHKNYIWKKKKKLQFFAQKRKVRVREFRVIFQNWLSLLQKISKLVKLITFFSNNRLRTKSLVNKWNKVKIQQYLYLKWKTLYKHWFKISSINYGILKTLTDGKKYHEIKLNSNIRWSKIIKLTADFLSKGKKRVTKRWKRSIRVAIFRTFFKIMKIFSWTKPKFLESTLFFYKKIKKFSYYQLSCGRLKKKEQQVRLLKWKKKIHSTFFFINPQQFLIGGVAELSNKRYVSTLFFCKNNIDVFRPNNIRSRILSLHASFKWLYSSRQKVSLYKNTKFMFSSITGAFAKLMRWSALKTNGLYSGNRWLSGRLTAAINIPYIPDYIFIPDIDENSLIVDEAFKKNIVMMALVGSDTKSTVDLPIFGNNKEFDTIVKVIKLVISIIKPKAICTVRHPKIFFDAPNITLRKGRSLNKKKKNKIIYDKAFVEKFIIFSNKNNIMLPKTK